MSFQKILFAFVIVLALTLNVGFILGEIDNPAHHDAVELFLAIVVSLVATVMKFGDRSPLGSTMQVALIAAVAGAMVANVISVVLLVIETANQRR